MMSLLVSLLLWCGAWGAPFGGVGHDVRRLTAPDGAEVTLYHLHGNEKGPVILLEPGIVETAEMLDGIALSFHRRGYDVFIGQVRLAGRGQNRSGMGHRNGLEEVLLQDFPTHLREVIRVAAGRDVHLLGHSMGGMEIMATFSSAELAAEFSPHVKSATLLAAPHELSGLPGHLRGEAAMVLPLFKLVRKLLGWVTIDSHHTLFDMTRRMKESAIPLARRSAWVIESFFIKIGTVILNKILIDVNHTSPEALRRLWYKEISALPLDLLIEMAEATKRGRFVDRQGRELIRPENVKIPIQVVRAEHDQLVQWDSQESLFKRLGSKAKRMISLFGMLHVDPVIADQPLTDFMVETIDFHDNAKKAVEKARELGFSPKTGRCEVIATFANPDAN